MRKKIVLITLILCSLNLLAEDERDNFLEIGNPKFENEQSSWVFAISTNAVTGLELAVPGFTGTEVNISDEAPSGGYTVYGASLHLGRDIYFGRFVVGVYAEGFHHKQAELSVGKFSKSIDKELVSGSDQIEINGLNGYITLGYMFKRWQLAIIPFVEIGGGSSIINTRFKSTYTDEFDVLQEDYDLVRNETYSHLNTAIGIKFLSSKGVMSWIKISQNSMTRSSSDISKYTTVAGAGPEVDRSSEADDVISGGDAFSTINASLGWGVQFH